MKFCPECGAAVSGGKFCSECGHRLQDNVVPNVSAPTPPPAGIGFDLPDLGGFDALGVMADNCLAQDQARQEAEALAPFEVEKHQNGKYAILALKDKSEVDIVVPNSVEAIGDGAFEGSDILTVILPEGLRKIGARAFADCEDLEEINFPKSLRVIGDEAFAGCVNLDVEPPEGVRIGKDAFLDTYPDLCRQQEEEERRAKEEEEARHREAEEQRKREEQAARERDPKYCYQQAENCRYGNNSVKKNEAEAIKWYRKAADLGAEEAQYELGECYYYGLSGVKKDEEEAVEWYRMAAEQGHAKAQFKLGECYYEGEGVEKNYAEAARLFRLAAEQGHGHAALKVGEYYYWGIYVSKSLSEAERWFNIASYCGWKTSAQAYLNRIKNERGW